jgi:hypothetical protein
MKIIYQILITGFMDIVKKILILMDWMIYLIMIILKNQLALKKFYNCSEGKYYNIGDAKFVWPEIAYGTINELNKIYGIYIQKCNNKTIKYILGDNYKCKNDSEIDLYFNIRETKIVNFYFINHLINILNYKNANTRFFNRIENPFKKGKLTQNNINFNPILVRSHDGFAFDHISEDISYTFDRNDVYIDSNIETNI